MSELQAERRLIAADPLADRDLSSELARVRRSLLVEVDRPARRARRRRRVIPAAVAAATAAVAVGAALLPSSTAERAGVLPAPVQAFAYELGGEGVLHVVTHTSILAGGRALPLPEQPARMAMWYELGGSRWRMSIGRPGVPTYSEVVSDGRIVDIVSDRHGLVGRSDLRQVGRAWREQLTPFWLPELRSALLAGTARIAGDATVRGRPAYRVALDLAPLDAYAPDTHVFVARDDHSMLRIDRQSPPLSAAPMATVSRSEVLVYDVLPATPDHLRLLDLPPGLRRTPRSNAPPDGST